MLYYLHYLTDQLSPLRVLQYVTVRALGAAATAFLVSLLLGPAMIRWLRRLKFGQNVRTEKDSFHLGVFHGRKQGTPTMGGLLIIVSVTAACLLWAVPTNGFVWLALGTMIYMGGVGFWDDYLKVVRKRSLGLGAKQKLVLQLAWVAVMVAILTTWAPTREHVRHLMVPFVKDPVVADLGLLGVLVFVGLVIVGSTNAVNLTDGLDGLAVGCSSSVAIAYLIMAYVAGNAVLAKYLLVPFVAGSHELAVFCAALLGGCLGFLWFNCHPARVFMGDTGSFALGGAISMVAVLVKQELALIIVGGVFVIEAGSVLLQVAYFKWTGGRRIFLCSPLHHHFEYVEKERAEKEGRAVEVVETLITIRFWILSIIFALLGVATLKIR
jgi:phospho-N-acetylmuramoyl-pentapeptide-transferase